MPSQTSPTPSPHPISSPSPNSHSHSATLPPPSRQSGWALLHLRPGLHRTGLHLAPCTCICFCMLPSPPSSLSSALVYFVLDLVLLLHLPPPPPLPPTTTTTTASTSTSTATATSIHFWRCQLRLQDSPPASSASTLLDRPTALCYPTRRILHATRHDHVQVQKHSSSSARNRKEGPNVENKVFTARPL